MSENYAKESTAVHSSKKKLIMATKACPEILDWWDSEKNDGADPAKITAGSHHKFFFKCPKCGEKMHREMYHFLIKQKDGTYTVPVCQKCTPTMLKHRVSLIDAVPDIEKYWDYEKNEGKKPSDFSKAASEKVWTYCPICGTSVRRNVRFSWKADENGIGHVIHCRTCGKRKDDNSLVEIFPDIKRYWVYEKNEHEPEYYTISSGKKVFVKCPDCGRERKLAICDAVAQDMKGQYYVTSCPDCAKGKNLLVRRQKNSNIEKSCPDIHKYWDEKNEIRSEELTVHSLVKIYTHCPSCGDLLYRRATNTFKEECGVWHVIKCQSCAVTEANARKALLKNGPVIDECPEIEEWWDYEKNTIGLGKVTRGSHYEAYFKCPACHKGLKRDVHSFVAIHRDGRLLPVACPECGYSSKGDPEDNLVNVCPEIVRWWDYEKNAPFQPEQFTKGSQFMAYMKCPDCGCELYSGIHSMLHTDENGKVVVSHDGRCRKYKAMASKNNLVSRYPQITDWWDYKKNSPELPEEYTLYSPKRVYFKCPECGTETHRRITDAFFCKDDGIPALFKCPYCKGTKVLPGFNSLDVVKPELAAEWSPNNQHEASEFLPTSHYPALWHCPRCNGEYVFRIADREVDDDTCPYCRNKKVLPGFNSFKVRHPDLMDTEWADIENTFIRVNPDQILDSYCGSVWWKCPICNKKYMMSVKDRIMKKKRGHNPCTFCNGRRWKKTYIV